MSEKKESIKRYTLEEIKQLRSTGQTASDWNYALNLNQSEANKNAENGEVNFNDDNFWNNIEFACDSKKLINIALDPEVALFYKKLGTDCQNTINSVLKAYMLVQEHRVYT